MKLSGNEVYYTACPSLVTLHNSCSKVHCQKVSIEFPFHTSFGSMVEWFDGMVRGGCCFPRPQHTARSGFPSSCREFASQTSACGSGWGPGEVPGRLATRSFPTSFDPGSSTLHSFCRRNTRGVLLGARCAGGEGT